MNVITDEMIEKLTPRQLALLILEDVNELRPDRPMRLIEGVYRNVNPRSNVSKTHKVQ